jgi:flagellar hook-associated protein 1 FlgK
MSLFSALSSASNALAAFQSALTVTQNNVNNASTPGYVTQTQTFDALSFVPGTGATGGVEAGAVVSSRDQFAEQNVRSATSQLGNFEQQVQSLTPLQGQFDISGNSGIPAALNTLTSAFSNWSTLPNDSTARQNVISSAQSVASAFQQIASNISQVTQTTDAQTATLVNQVNNLTAQLGGYNSQIVAGGQNDPALDAAVNSTIESLSEVANVTTIKQPDGTFSVMLGGQTTLVAGTTVDKLTAGSYIPSTPVIHSGGPVTVPVTIRAGVNDALNLKIDGTTLPAIHLNPSDTSLAAVASDINTQLTATGSTATASVDVQGRLVLASGGTGPSASVQILPGNGNAALGLSTSVPPQARVTDSTGTDVTGQITGGKLGGNLAVRNQAIPAIQGDASQTGSLNQLAQSLADRVNSLMGIPLFTYDSTSATNIANSLQVNSSITAQQLPNAQVVSLTGNTPANPIAITAGTNDGLNLNVDGKTWPTIVLNPADTNVSTVAADLNAQFSTLGIGATASVNANSGGLTISTTNTAAGGSMQILSGTANASLGLTQTTPTYQSAVNGVALSLSALANPGNPSDEINGQSYTQFFGSIAAQVGSQLSMAQSAQSAQQDMVTQAQSLRQQVSGVDLNTEATQVLQLQESYQAASKMLNVIDNLTQTVLGLITPSSVT